MTIDEIYDLSFKLHNELKETNEYKKLKEVENEMLSDSLTSKLIDDYKKLEEKYGVNKNEKVLNELHKAKLAMDENELVKKYKKAYKEYMIIVSNVTDIAFEGFKQESIIDLLLKGI